MFSWIHSFRILSDPGLRRSQSMLQNWPLFKTNEPPWHPPAELSNAFSQMILDTFSHSTKKDEELCATDLPISGLLLGKAFSSPTSLLSHWVSQTRVEPDLQSLHYCPFSQPPGVLDLSLK